MDTLLLYVGASLPLIWGMAHLMPTRSVVRGFGSLSADNARIITMEWVVEGVALICLGGTLAAVTSVDHAGRAATVVYATPSASLVALAVVSLFTGFTISFIPFKLCPAIRPSSAVLMLLGTLP